MSRKQTTHKQSKLYQIFKVMFRKEELDTIKKQDSEGMRDMNMSQPDSGWLDETYVFDLKSSFWVEIVTILT